MNIGIVGHGEDKFTPTTRKKAIECIEGLISHCDTVVSGRSPVGGIDIWAEQVAENIGAPTLIFPPKCKAWDTGYKPRNILIAQHSDIVHCIVVTRYPPGYKGMVFQKCYHCFEDRQWHVKSGGCWTAKYALGLGKQTQWHFIR